MLGETNLLLDMALAPGTLLIKAIPPINDGLVSMSNKICGDPHLQDGSADPAQVQCVNGVGTTASLVVTLGLAFLAYKLFMKGK